ncbi:unnamed protein product [Cunninghamella blakesleeana]
MARKRKTQVRYRRPYNTTKIIHDIQQTEKQKYHVENEQVKKQAILTAIKEKDIDELRRLGKDYGFIHNNLRKKVWPLLLHCTLTNKKNKITTYKSRKHKDEEQVFLDIKRSFNTFPKDLDERRKKVLQLELNQVIVQVLRSFPKLHYYQGFHDICTVFLLLFGQSNAIQLISHVALFYLRDAMLDSLEPILKEIELLNTLYRLKNEKLYDHFQSMGVLPYYCLSWMITWFSHDLSDLEDIYRIFDLVLSTHPMMPLYITASLVLLKYKPEDLGDDDDDLDPSLLHHHLCKLPYQPDLEWEPILQYAIELYTTYSPLELQYHAQFGLSQVSSLNTFHEHSLFYDSSIIISKNDNNNNNMYNINISEKEQYYNDDKNRIQQEDNNNDDDNLMLENRKVEKWIQQACDILAMDAIERNQTIDIGKQNLKHSSSSIKGPNGMPLWMMIGAVGLGTVAIILSISQSPSDLLSSLA